MHTLLPGLAPSSLLWSVRQKKLRIKGIYCERGALYLRSRFFLASLSLLGLHYFKFVFSAPSEDSVAALPYVSLQVPRESIGLLPLNPLVSTPSLFTAPSDSSVVGILGLTEPNTNPETVLMSRSANGSSYLQDASAEHRLNFDSGLLPQNFSEYSLAKNGRELPTPPPPPPIDLVRDEFPDCPMECEDGWIQDDWCDGECFNEKCGFDGGDCEGWCAGECRPGWPGDGQCDIDCYKEECDWDGGDCPDYRARDLPRLNLNASEDFDYSNCSCDMTLLNDGKCDKECNNYDCRLDGLDCKHECDDQCPTMWMGDGVCDWECDRPECFNDKRDCDSCAPGCRTWMLQNGVCDMACNIQECQFDQADCTGILDVVHIDYDAKPFVYEFCAKEFLGDGHCDATCYTEKGLWDGGDCESTDMSTYIGVPHRRLSSKRND